jgi:hypothetical protein
LAAVAIPALLAAIVVATTVSLTAAPPAVAATQPVACAELQTTINEDAAAARHGEGDVIVLRELCGAGNLGSSAGVRLPAESNLAIEGAAGTAAGFNGAGITGPLLATAESERAGTITVSNLIFEHANLTEASALSLLATRATLSGDTFREDEERGGGGHTALVVIDPSTCPAASAAPALTVTDSRFSDNRLVLGAAEGGGAGAWLKDTCAASRNVLEGNAFEANTIESAGATVGAQVTGAGLQFVGGPTVAAPVSQRGNVFDSNQVVASGAAVGDYGGGGEWLVDAALTSTGDRFSRNTVPGTVSPSESSWSWGAGVGIILPTTLSTCNENEPSESTFADAVITGNTITAGRSAALGGGGIWVGCLHLRVLDSTVTLNTSSIGAGIEGEPAAQLELFNSIVAEDRGGNETAGFTGKGGELDTSHSDVCASEGSATALPGTANICAAPHLANEGNSDSVDVHETAASPTIDAGSNSLVPPGLTADFYDNTRLLTGTYSLPACNGAPIVRPVLNPATVDMGASEFGPVAVPAIAIRCPAKVSTFSLPRIVRRRRGRLVLHFKDLAVGHLTVRATFSVRRRLLEVMGGRRHHVVRTETLVYGQVARTVTTAGKVGVTLLPTAQALAILRRHKRLRVRVTVTFTATGSESSTRGTTVALTYRPRTASHRQRHRL